MEKTEFVPGSKGLATERNELLISCTTQMNLKSMS